MHVGIAAPVTLSLLKPLHDEKALPMGYDFPMISSLVNSLLEKGHNVTVYTTSEDISKPVIIDKANLSVCIARRMPHAARDLFRSERNDLEYLMKKRPVDLINAHWTYEFAWAAISTKIPTLVTMHDHAATVFRYKSDPYRFMRLLMNYIVLNKINHLSVISEYLYQLLSKSNQKKAKIISDFYPLHIEKYICNYKCKRNYIISVNNGFGKRKNIQNALLAFSLIRDKFKDIEYYLVGDDMQEGGPAYRFAKENNIHNGVKFWGKLSYDEMLKKVRRAKIFLHPSKEESFGMSVLESMVVGTLVIGGNNSGNIPNLLNNGKAGILCNINSPRKIAESLIYLLENPDLLEKISTSAKDFAKVNFAENVIVDKYISYYNNILEQINGFSR